MTQQVAVENLSKSKHIFLTPKVPNLEFNSLISSVIIGFAHMNHLRYKFTKDSNFKNENAAFLCFKKLKRNPENKKALHFLKSKILTLTQDLNLSCIGPYPMEETLEQLSLYFGAKIRVLSHGGTSIIFTFPKNEKLGQKPEINLLLIENNCGKTLNYIENIHLYVKPFGLFCHICNRILKKKKHKCSDSQACYACGRARLLPNDQLFEVYNSHKFYCREVPDQWKHCPECRIVTKSKQCAKFHKRKAINCKHKRQCTLCNRNYVVNKKIPHDCKKNKFCQICFTYYEQNFFEEHFCRLQEQKDAQYYPPLAAYDFETKATNKAPTSCIDCALKEALYLQRVQVNWSQLAKEEKINLLCHKHQDCDPDEKDFHEGD